MNLIVDGIEREFIPIKTFRESHSLADTFGVSLFEPKDFEGLGRIDEAGAEMNNLRESVLAAIPEHIDLSYMLDFLDDYQNLFRIKLYDINDTVGLREAEIEFAVSGFGDMLRNAFYALMHARSAKEELPPFMQVYGEWLNSSIRISKNIHEYAHNGAAWQVHIVNHVYGRVGLQVETGSETTYVYDGVYTCPAEGFMVTLFQEVVAHLWDVIGS